MTLTQHLPRPHPDPKLVSPKPTASAPASVRISHVQLRDLMVCPAERGVLWYVSENSIIEQDILSNTPSLQRTLALLTFTPVTLSTLRLASSCPSGKDVILLAAGGQDAELFLALYIYTPRRTRQGKTILTGRSFEQGAGGSMSTAENSTDMDKESTVQDVKEEEDAAGYSTSSWQHVSSLVGSINNNVLLYVPPAPADHTFSEGAEIKAVSPRLVVSNNDCTVKFFDVSLARKGLRRSTPQRPQAHIINARYLRHDHGLRGACEGEGWGEHGLERIVRYERVGCLRLPVPVNHTSISPDGSTVLSCGDASTIYLHRILPVRDGTSLLFEPLATYTVPVPAPLPTLRSPPPSQSTTRPYLPPYPGHQAYHDSAAYLPFAFVNGAWVLAGAHPYYNEVTGVEVPPACFTTAWSADGTRFAVASQEGAVRVWDIRSKEPLSGAGWETGPRGDREAGEDGTLNSDVQRVLLDFTGGAPPWGVRSLKFARNASGRELLVFTEHVSRVHIIDADTFSTHDVLRVPHVQPSASGPLPRDNSNLPPFPPGWSVDVSSAPTTNQRHVHSTGTSYTPPWVTSAHTDYLPRFVIDASALPYGPMDGATGIGPSPTTGSSESEINAEVDNMVRRARADLRSEARSLGISVPRRRRTGLMPPEARPSGTESNTGTDRVLSPNIPFARSPEPSAYRTFADVALEGDILNAEATIQRAIANGTYGTGHVALAQRINEHIRMRARARELRELDGEQDERRRRNPSSTLRDDAQMEEDIAYHAALERMRNERDRMQVTRERTLAMLERRRARLARERADREQEGTERARARTSSTMLLDEHAAYHVAEYERIRSGAVNSEHGQNEGDAGPEAIVIPPLSSARSEEDVRNVLAVHGISSVRSRVGGDAGADGSQNERPVSSTGLQGTEHRRPSFSSASTTSSTSLSATTSTRAHAGSLNGERPDASRGRDIDSLLTPSIRNMRAAQAALRAIDAYRMDVDGEDGDDGDDSDATELDCAEPNATVQDDGPTSGTSAGPSSIGTGTEATISSSTSPALSAVTATSITSMPPSFPSSPPSLPNTAPTTDQPFPTSFPSSSSSASPHSLPPCRDLIESTDRLDVAGVAFDPRGAYMYVATVDGITEWAVKGAEQRWWNAGGCI